MLQPGDLRGKGTRKQPYVTFRCRLSSVPENEPNNGFRNVSDCISFSWKDFFCISVKHFSQHVWCLPMYRCRLKMCLTGVMGIDVTTRRPGWERHPEITVCYVSMSTVFRGGRWTQQRFQKCFCLNQFFMEGVLFWLSVKHFSQNAWCMFAYV